MPVWSMLSKLRLLNINVQPKSRDRVAENDDGPGAEHVTLHTPSRWPNALAVSSARFSVCILNNYA